MKVKKANKATLNHGTERRDRDGSDRARPPRDARRPLRHVLSAYKQKKKKSQNCFCQAAPIPKRDADALRARVAALRHVLRRRRINIQRRVDGVEIDVSTRRRAFDYDICPHTQVAGADRHLHGVIK